MSWLALSSDVHPVLQVIARERDKTIAKQGLVVIFMKETDISIFIT
jgi:hypothetical protein